MAPFDDKYGTFSVILTVMCVPFVTIFEIFANQIKFQKFDLENEGEGQEVEKPDLCHSTGHVCCYIGDFSPRI